MIRPVKTTNGETSTVYGLTIRGVAALGAEWGVTIAAILLSVFALSHANTAVGTADESTHQRILLTCEEANDRHNKAKLGIEALIAKSPPKSTLPKKVQEEQLALFINALSPEYVAGRGSQAQREAQGCAKRVAELTKP